MAPRAGSSLIGSGSSFAGPEVLQWTSDTSKAPYNLTVDFTPTSSGDGRFNFGNNTVDFAVSDIPYQSQAFDTKQPTFPFMYLPVTAGGLAFMYHINGLGNTKLQLSSYSICAIMTGGAQKWNDPPIAQDNPGVPLPATQVHPVIRADLAGTNFVLQEYCIHEQPAMWRAFVTSPAVTQDPGQVGDLSPTDPRSDWPHFPGAILVNGSATAADTVASSNNDGYITAVETTYALQRHMPTASMKNTSGKYTQPTPVNVASALAYATQNSNGTHSLNFDGLGPNVYNPSTYSYLLTPTTGWSAAKGATLSAFANYALTLGQQKATSIGYASLGLSLEQYGVNAIKQSVPGAVALTSLEQGAYQCGDLTVADVQAGKTQATCGVLNSNNSTTPGQAAKGGGGTTATGARTSGSGGSGAAGGGSGSGAGGGSGGSGAGINPGVSLGGSPALAFTGVNILPIVLPGITLLAVGLAVRRRLRARMR
jgi:ABC-type phosphate transport system substrate-binding protein